MGPELIVSMIAPVFTAIVSVTLWQNKKHHHYITTNFRSLNTSTNVIESKIDDLRFDVAKNYVTNDDLASHIQIDRHLSDLISREMNEVRSEVADLHKAVLDVTLKVDNHMNS